MKKLGSSLLPSAQGWDFGARTAQKYRKRENTKNVISAFRRSEFSELQNRKFSFPSAKGGLGRATSKKCRENFSVLGLKFLQNFRAESGAEQKPKTFFKSFPGKRFELCGKFVPRLNFPKFLRFFVRRFAKIASVFAVWRALRARPG